MKVRTLCLEKPVVVEPPRYEDPTVIQSPDEQEVLSPESKKILDEIKDRANNKNIKTNVQIKPNIVTPKNREKSESTWNWSLEDIDNFIKNLFEKIKNSFKNLFR